MRNAALFALGALAAPVVVAGGHWLFPPVIALGLLAFAFGTMAVLAFGDKA